MLSLLTPFAILCEFWLIDVRIGLGKVWNGYLPRPTCTSSFSFDRTFLWSWTLDMPCIVPSSSPWCWKTIRLNWSLYSFNTFIHTRNGLTSGFCWTLHVTKAHKKIPAFPVTRPSLFFLADPNLFGGKKLLLFQYNTCENVSSRSITLKIPR